MKFRALEPYEQGKKVDLKSIPGKRFRRQSFTLPLLVTLVTFLYLPYMISILLIAFGDFSLSALVEIIVTDSILLLPPILLFAVLWILNRRFFGRIVCVSAAEGLYHAGGLIPWEQIQSIWYEIQLPDTRFYLDPQFRFCHAVVNTKHKQFKLIHAPLRLLRHTRKHHPQISIGITKSSKFLLILLSSALLAIPPIILLLYTLGEKAV